MLVTRDLERETWSVYFDAISDELRNEFVSVLITDPPSPPALQASQLALQGLSYDRRGDVFEVMVARGGPRVPSVLRHMVDHPKRISVDSPTSLAPTLIEIEDAEGVCTVITIGRAAPFVG